MTSELRPFHLAMPVDDLMAARHFYGDLLGMDFYVEGVDGKIPK